jgi:site-specific recombinase XerD
MPDLVTFAPAPAPALPIADLDRAAQYARAEKADSTRRAYRDDFNKFRVWCLARGVDALPATAETVAAFLASEAEAGLKPSTIQRRACAIRYAHKLADFEPPTNSESVRAVARGIRRTAGSTPIRKTPVLAETAREMMFSAPNGLKGLHDRVLISLGFSGAFRRSELVALNVGDLEETEDGYRVTIRRSKTDQVQQGAVIAIIRGGACCQVKAAKAWLAESGISEGPIFRPVGKGGRLRDSRLTAKSVCDLVKVYAGRLGLTPADFGAHSLRSGDTRAWTSYRRTSGTPIYSATMPGRGYCRRTSSPFRRNFLVSKKARA